MKTIAIIGRPNVGKSTLFNRLIGDRLAIEDEAPGTTRDPVSAEVTLDDQPLVLMDSGGIDFSPESSLEEEVQDQVESVGSRADVLLFVVSLEEGITALDRKIARKIRSSFLQTKGAEGEPSEQESSRKSKAYENRVVLAANKMDTSDARDHLYDFYELGFGEPISISALQRRGLVELRETLASVCRQESDVETTTNTAQLEEPVPPRRDTVSGEPSSVRLSLIGRQNVGKSTYMNQIAQRQRSIVTDVPGTTRDLLQVQMTAYGRQWKIVDTPGFQKEGNENNTIEMWSQKRVIRAIRKSDVIFHFFDSTQSITRVDQDLQNFVQDQYKPCALLINKWDLVTDDVSLEDYSEYFYDQLPSTRNFPLIGISALHGQNVWETFDLADHLVEQAGKTVSDSKLKEVFTECVEEHPPSGAGVDTGTPVSSQIIKVFQEQTFPPHIVAVLPDPSVFSENDRRYLHNTLSERLPFYEVPFRLTIRAPER